MELNDGDTGFLDTNNPQRKRIAAAGSQNGRRANGINAFGVPLPRLRRSTAQRGRKVRELIAKLPSPSRAEGQPFAVTVGAAVPRQCRYNRCPPNSHRC
jgi:hypothetical protein